MRQLKKN
jgi:hypothetical protein